MINQTAPDTTDEVEDILDADQLSEIKKKSVSGAVSFLIRTAILQGIGLASAFVLSAYFSPEDFGIYGFVTQIIGLLVFFSDVGLAASLIQKKEEPSLADYRTAFTIQQSLSWLIVGLALAIVATGIVQQKTGSTGVWILISLAISFPLASLKTIPSIMLERKLEFSKLVIPQIIEQLALTGLLIFLAWQKMGALSYAYAIGARSILGLVTMWLIQPWSIGLAIDKASAKTLLGYGVKFQLNDFLARIKDQLFFLVLAFFLPLREFGYIQWAKNWSLYPYNLTVQNVMAITFPTFSRLQGNKPALQKAIEKSLFFITLVIFPLLIGMCVFIGPLTEVIPRYAKWQPALWGFMLFTLSIAWAAISTPLTNTLNAVGKINQTLKLMVMWTVLTWILTPILVWKFGFNGVALSTGYFLYVFPANFVCQKSSSGSSLGSSLATVTRGWSHGSGWAPGSTSLGPNFALMGVGILTTGITYVGVLSLVGLRKVTNEFKSLR